MVNITGKSAYQSKKRLGDSNSPKASCTKQPSRASYVGQRRHCNLCRDVFVPEFKYQLFCGRCRKHNDAFIFNEWLPRVPERYAFG